MSFSANDPPRPYESSIFSAHIESSPWFVPHRKADPENATYRLVELVQSGAIGKIHEMHVWVGVNYTSGRLITKKRPAHVDWDLWLGPAMERPYCEATINGKHETVHPFHWRWFWDYGTGGLGDFGCHYMDLPTGP